jgi:hypothetical protein
MNSRYLLPAVLCLGALVSPTRAQTVGTCEPSLGEAFLDIGNVRARILNNGGFFWRGSPSVYEVPKGSGKSLIFVSTIWLGGMIDQQLHMAGSSWGPFEFWAGPIPDDGTMPRDCRRFDRVWSVTRLGVLGYEATGVSTQDLRDWPTGLGAPTVDANGVPVDLLALPLAERLGRKIDLESGERPDITGDQMLWWIMNDLGGPHNRSDGVPLGVEIHGSAFAFDSPGALGNTTFYRLLIRKPTGPSIEYTHLGIHQDAVLGWHDDNYVGSDSVRGLAYTYNSDNNDEGAAGYGAAPPAVGIDFFQGPLVDEDLVDNDSDGHVGEPGERGAMASID